MTCAVNASMGSRRIAPGWHGANELMSWLARRQYLTEELAGQGRFAQATETLHQQSLTAAQPSAHLVLQRSVTDSQTPAPASHSPRRCGGRSVPEGARYQTTLPPPAAGQGRGDRAPVAPNPAGRRSARHQSLTAHQAWRGLRPRPGAWSHRWPGRDKTLLRARAQLIANGTVVADDLDKTAAMQGCGRGRPAPQHNIDRRADVARGPGASAGVSVCAGLAWPGVPVAPWHDAR